MNPRIGMTVAMALAAGSFAACAGKDKPSTAQASPTSAAAATREAPVATTSANAGANAGAEVATPTAAQPVSSEPRQRTLGLIATLVRVKQPLGKRSVSAADKAENRKIFAELDDYFDFDKMIRATIGPHIGEFNEEQLARFNTIFATLVRLVAYPRAGGFLEDCDKTIGVAKIDGKMAKVPMHASRRYEDLEMDVSYYWEQQDRWRLIDVAFDGAPLTKEYQNRIGRVIEEDGVTGLLRKIAKRLHEEQRVLQ